MPLYIHLINTIAHTTDPDTIPNMAPADTSAPAADHPIAQAATTTHDTGQQGAEEYAADARRRT